MKRVCRLVVATSAIVSVVGAQSPTLFFPPVLHTVTPPIALGEFVSGGLALGDFNNDGYQDAVVGNGHSQVWMSPGGPGGVFGPAIPSTASPLAGRFISALKGIDANSDGLLDLVVISTEIGRVRILLNTGGGSFVLGGLAPIPFNFAPQTLADFVVDDLDGDGGVDVAVTGLDLSSNSGNLRVFTATAGGTAITQVLTVSSPNLISPVAMGDLSADGLKDIVFTERYPTRAIVLRRNAGGAGFTQLGPFDFPNAGASWAPYEIVAGDANGDGIGDVVAYGQIGSVPISIMTTLLGTSSGQLVPGTAYPAPTVLEGGVRTRGQIGDFDLDGFADVRAHASVYRIVPAWYGGAETLVHDTGPGLANVPSYVATDVDGDGDLDVIMAQEDSSSGLGDALRLGVCENGTIYRPALCAGPNPAMQFGAGRPAPGNPAYALSLAGAPPGAIAVVGVTMNPGIFWSGCIVWLDPDPAQVIFPAPWIGVVTTDAAGSAQIGLAIPPLPGLIGEDFFAQWIVASPGGSLVVLGNTFNVSFARRIVIW